MANVKSKKSGAERKTKSNHIKNDLYSRYGVVCAFCGKEGDMGPDGKISREGFNIDHIVPVARGGEDVADNMQILCRKCNLDKGELTNEEYFAANPKESKEIVVKPTIELLVKEDNLSFIKYMYRPLPKDLYQAWVVFYTSVIDTAAVQKNEEIIWFKLPLNLVEQFCVSYNTSRDVLEGYMTDIHTWLNAIEEEKKIKQRILGVAHINTLDRQGNDLHAVSLNKELMKSEKKTANVIINLNSNVLNYAQKYVQSPKPITVELENNDDEEEYL